MSAIKAGENIRCYELGALANELNISAKALSKALKLESAVSPRVFSILTSGAVWLADDGLQALYRHQRRSCGKRLPARKTSNSRETRPRGRPRKDNAQAAQGRISVDPFTSRRSTSRRSGVYCFSPTRRPHRIGSKDYSTRVVQVDGAAWVRLAARVAQLELHLADYREAQYLVSAARLGIDVASLADCDEWLARARKQVRESFFGASSDYQLSASVPAQQAGLVNGTSAERCHELADQSSFLAVLGLVEELPEVR